MMDWYGSLTQTWLEIAQFGSKLIEANLAMARQTSLIVADVVQTLQPKPKPMPLWPFGLLELPSSAPAAYVSPYFAQPRLPDPLLSWWPNQGLATAISTVPAWMAHPFAAFTPFAQPSLTRPFENAWSQHLFRQAWLPPQLAALFGNPRGDRWLPPLAPQPRGFWDIFSDSSRSISGNVTAAMLNALTPPLPTPVGWPTPRITWHSQY